MANGDFPRSLMPAPARTQAEGTTALPRLGLLQTLVSDEAGHIPTLNV